MICFPINMSTPWTRFHYVSNKRSFMDTYPEHVPTVDMKEQVQNMTKLESRYSHDKLVMLF